MVIILLSDLNGMLDFLGKIEDLSHLHETVIETDVESIFGKDDRHFFLSVSYTHLTLPTIYSV